MTRRSFNIRFEQGPQGIVLCSLCAAMVPQIKSMRHAMWHEELWDSINPEQRLELEGED